MNKRIIKSVSLFLAIILVFSLAACSNKQTDVAFQYDGNLKIVNGDTSFEIAFNDIFKMKSVTKTVKSVSSSGEELTSEVKGVLLNTLLATKNLKREDYHSIRFIAGDGYQIDVPKEIISQKEIILGYEFNGEPLEEKKQPLRPAIDDVRSMYFVSNLVEIQLNTAPNNGEVEKVDKVIILETEAKHLEQHDYTYYESTDKAIKVADLFTKYNVSADLSAKIIATENFVKTEKNNVLTTGFFKITGEARPLFLSPDLPKGMHVKNIVTVSTNNKVFLSAEQAIATLPTRDVNGTTGAKLEEVMKLVNLNEEFYVLTADDGYAVEVTKESLEHGILYINDKGQYKITFDETMPKSTTVKYIHSFSKGDGKNAIATTAKSDSTPTGSDAVAGEWSIMFEGLSDGSFEFTSDRAERKLELVNIDTTITKNDKEVKDSYSGYRVLDILKFLKVTDFNKLVLTASDGYALEFSKEEITENTIFAVAKNDEAMKDEDLVRLVQDSQFATKWIKSVNKVTVK